MKRLSKKMIALVLASVFVVSSSITAVLVFAQVVPYAVSYRPSNEQAGPITANDLPAREDGAVLRPSAVPPKRQADGQDYNGSWGIAFDGNTSLDIDVMAISVELIPYEGSVLLIDFDGWAYPFRSGEYPVIHVSELSSAVTVKESRTQERNGSYNNNQGLIEGVLTIQIPKGELEKLQIDTFSGRVAAADLKAAGIQVDTSSGNVELLNIISSGVCDVSTFSGSVRLVNLTASQAMADTSSGSVEATNITANSFTSDRFSGDSIVTGAEIGGQLSLNGSSGKTEVRNASCGSLDVSSFSGNITISDTISTGNVETSTSSGTVKLTNVKGGEVEADTFSGSVTCEQLTTEGFEVSTSSGSVKAQLLQGCDVDVSTFSGSVELTVPKDYEFELEFSTFSGGNSIGFPIMLQSQSGGKNIQGVVGRGTYEVEVSTSSGSLTIQPEK